MLNFIWLWLILLAVIIGGFTGRIKEVTGGAFKMAEDAIMTIALPLAGVMALWLGIMRLAELSGIVQVLAKTIRPVTRKLFPDVPPEHPAMGSMLMNIAANMLGLANAATPLGLRAMRDLESLNPRPGVATNAMCTFLAINTSSVQLVPATAVSILAVAGAKDPTAIIGTAFLATTCSTIAGLTAVKLLEKLPAYRLPQADLSAKETDPTTTADGEELASERTVPRITFKGKLLLTLFLVLFGLIFAVLRFPDAANGVVASLGQFAPQFFSFQFAPLSSEMQQQGGFSRSIGVISLLAVPFLLSFFPLYASVRGVKVYEEFVEGAKEGFQVAVRIIPFLVAILVAVKMFREAGGIAMLSQLLSPLLNAISFPVDLLPLVLIRPLSGGASLGMFSELVTQFGPDHLISRTAATIFGSTETTFYVVAVYFGSVAVRRTRHAVPAGLIADAVGVIASVIICRAMFG